MADSSPPATLDGYEIWQRTRAAVSSVQYPRRVAYTIAINGLDGDKPVSDHYRGAYDEEDGSVRIFPISDEQLAAPPVPRGVNAKLSISLCFGIPVCPVAIQLPVGHPAPYQDLIGVPLLAPTYMFGIRYNATPAAAKSEDNGGLRIIATVAAQAPEYQVALVDQPTLAGTSTYHLKLTPLRRPKENRLRALWIGAADYLPRKAQVAGNFTMAPLVDVPWTIDFSVIDGAPYVADESTPATLYLPHRRIVHDAVIAFQDIREPTSLYDVPVIEQDSDDTSLVEPNHRR